MTPRSSEPSPSATNQVPRPSRAGGIPTTVSEPARDIPVLARHDVVVCGGGPAGCAAAIASARAGARTLLVEQTGSLGGAPVTQNVVPILSTNGVDFQGVWHEWVRALRGYDGVTDLSRQERFGTTWLVGSVDPEAVKMAWDDLLSAAGAEVLHLALAVGVVVEDGCVRGAVVETRAGRAAVLAERVIDCTGDARLAAEAGCGFDLGADGAPWAMAVSLNAWYGNVPTAPDYRPGLPNVLGQTGRSLGRLPLFQAGLLKLPEIDPLDPWHLTRALRQGRREVWQRYRQRREEAGFESLFLAGVADQPGVRSSRRVHGLARASADDAWQLNRYDDGVARASWEIDIHSPTPRRRKAFEFDDPSYQHRMRRTEAGEWFDVRYGCLVPAGADGLLVAGRCISADHEAQASLRIQQTCMSLGQAAGTAAALSLDRRVQPRDLNVAELVAMLDRDRRAVEPAIDLPAR